MLIKAILGGALVMGAFTISLFFLRFWKSTQDRFFLYFAASFALEGMSRILSLVSDQGANEPDA